MSAQPKAITTAQKRAIHVALRHKSIDDDTYRELLQSSWGVTTCKNLTRRQASDLLARLGRPLRNPRGLHPAPQKPRREQRPDNVFTLASKAQRELIAELAPEIHWDQPDGYRKWLVSNQGLRRVTTDAEAARVIEGLMSIKRRQRSGKQSEKEPA